MSLISLGVLAVGFAIASRPDQVYAPATDYVATRPIATDGTDRLYVTANVTKLLDCELERGSKVPWVEFYDGSGFAPPVSKLYHPDGSTVSKTLHRAGESYVIHGYNALVPTRIRELHGEMILRIPCQLWSTAENGERAYGRQVVASFGPISVPLPGTQAIARSGIVAYHLEVE